MYRRNYPRIGLLAGLLALVMMTFVTTSAQARGDVSDKLKRAARSGVAATAPTGTLTAPVKFTSADGTFDGVFVPSKFVNRGDQVLAKGVVVGQVTRPGATSQWVSQAAAMPVKTGQVSSNTASAISPTAVPVISCKILNLVLGPLHLDLLGLVIDLNQVVLNITAVPAGGLLGQLLCDVANLLSGGLSGLLGQLAILLNQILGQLGL